jgi:hypothetical protein
MSNINGGMGRGGRSALSSVDFYRRVPKDLTEVRVICGAFVVNQAASKQASKQQARRECLLGICVGSVRRFLVQNSISSWKL